MSFKYYLSAWLNEFNTRWTYLNCNDGIEGEICGDKLKILKYLDPCTPFFNYLEKSDLDKMRGFLESGVVSEDLGEFARSAKLSAKVGKKWCVDILLVSIKWSIEHGPGIIKDATYRSSFIKNV